MKHTDELSHGKLGYWSQLALFFNGAPLPVVFCKGCGKPVRKISDYDEQQLVIHEDNSVCYIQVEK
jgi:hypothetical protein